VEEYYQAINENTIPIHRGINVSDEDILYRKHILNIACKGKTDWKNDFEITSFMKDQLNDLQKDGLVEWNDSQLEVTNLGWSFLRNICAVFDKKMNDNKHQQSTAPQFSQAV
jgi:oxygen-independent coproporphyrinogen-3 oxidase